MDIWKKMKQCEGEMTPKEHEVYELIQKHTFLFASSTASDLASRFNISQSAISRFCKRIGYEGYSDFRLDCYVALHSKPFVDKSQLTSHDQAYYLSQLVLETNKMLSTEQLEQLCLRMQKAATVFVTGHGNSYPPSYILSLHLMLEGKRSFTVQPGFEIETLHMVEPNDVIVLFTAENATHRKFLSFVKDMPQRKRPYIVLVTNIKQHPLRKMANEVIVLPTWTSLDYPVYVDSSVGPIVFCFLFIDIYQRLVAQQKEASPPSPD